MPRTLNPTSVPSEDTIIPWTPPPRKKILDPRMMIAMCIFIGIISPPYAILKFNKIVSISLRTMKMIQFKVVKDLSNKRLQCGENTTMYKNAYNAFEIK